MVGGVDLARQLFAHGLIDEIRVDVMPVLLGGGLRFFDGVEVSGVTLTKLRAQAVGQRTSLRYRVER